VNTLKIEQLGGGAALAAVDALARLIVDAVESGASVGFLRPLALADARRWAAEVAADVEAGRALLLAGSRRGVLCGSVQLRFASSENGRHRGEVAKLLVHRELRRRGVGTMLMEAVETAARAAGLRTLLLDTETGGDAERLYRRLGWTLVGSVPEYAVSPAGGLSSTSFYYRLI